ncbi:hypothetical protein QR680_007187 [Steinernema hermaphroditum]|uniref:7TM GPCR serpentine receptor class x (Srx) domain-containing protein n=1 Tax=Steinernema hermaphroditum TaxID=289476 RepID=A0AA39LXT5_9BILA|nr:hypothetical protein QR680_007187 [Steinernema hermaphroditum]
MVETSLSDQVRAANLMVLFGMLGVTIDGYVIYAIAKYKFFGHSFGAITISQMVATCGNSFMFATLVGPITMLHVNLHSTYWGARIGQILMVFWNASLFSHLLTAINRFVNLYFPYKYEVIFNETVTYVSIAFVWLLSIAQGIPYFWPECTLQFDTDLFTFNFIKTDCSYIIGNYLDFHLSIGVVFLIACIDFGSYLKIRRLQKNGALHLKSKDVKFFFQAWVQLLASVTELVLYFVIAPSTINHKWTHFCLTTLAWISVELVDGLVVILFNRDMRKNLTEPKPQISNNTKALPALRSPDARVHNMINV